MKRLVRGLLRRFGYDMIRYGVEDDARLRRQRLMDSTGVRFVLDVGANRGEYGLILRDQGYQGAIHSFEPASAAFGMLEGTISGDGLWQAHRCGLGLENGTATLNVAANSYSSSLLDMADAHEALAPGAGYQGGEEVVVRRLDAMWPELALPDGPGLLKVDTQGTELDVLRGAEAKLDRLPLLELELSFVELYGGQPLFDEVHAWLVERGYRPVSFDVGIGQVVPETGEALQADVIYRRG
ncbi:MAG: FkbM family methyltransferase [Rhodothermales bacterium]|nr:FkbM family methyltransferase [Rhodothermales bacterium]MBO6780070.1 FkbM family methyltransferase [Rhodothermales bacterium]